MASFQLFYILTGKDDSSVTFFFAGYKNYGTYQAKGNYLEVTIDKVGQDSDYASMVQEINKKDNVIVTPDQDTIEIEIKERDMQYIWTWAI